MVKPPGINKKLIIPIILLSIIGAIAVFSASAILSSELYGKPYYFFAKHLFYLMVGFTIMYLVIRSKTEFYKSPIFVYSLLILTIILLFLTFSSPIINNTQRWLRFGSFSFQPSELAKLSIILYLSYFFSKKREQVNKGIYGIIIPLIIVGLIVILIIKQPDFGTAAMIIILSGIIFYLGGVGIKYLLGIGTVFLMFGAVTLYFYNYALKRIVTLFDYESDPLGRGFQIIQSLIALGSGGISGVGLADSTQKLYYLPYAHTDFIFSVIGEEGGFIMTFLIVILFLYFASQGIKVSLKTKNIQNYLIASGITFWIVIQTLINISVVIGIFPPKGIPLPFLSYGGSSLVVLIFAVSILIKIGSGKSK